MFLSLTSAFGAAAVALANSTRDAAITSPGQSANEQLTTWRFR
jgi:hypothetical protein